ncbi:regulatory protein TetR [Deinococcus proteolyticus MRP]|uniref:Regulatory protein TetR n=1 Tax=Deinococcus proteolyticus (strain ATCC 35074 / DSM 20540 / JCM 6276 / NBRC 101906 / NCIMB 13154 / VKM Ac-1939 / CCM 2703 / MRP) TaxID=693977 RepID=F0RMD3_DEIPM|nr:TetR/AcrR family transcriptional regulator [Deinococcus proteolyticus]ADY27070.1 regulatory protein TetR [Deinococcus proteolyticus MRP]
MAASERTVPPQLRPRREPKQARSRRMVARILAAAAEEFAAVGTERATTNHIAARAGVSPGSLYQFFPGKAALLAALQLEWTERLRVELGAALRRVEGASAGEMVDAVLDTHARLNAEPLGLLAVLVFSRSQVPGSLDLRRFMAQQLEELLAVRAPSLSAERRYAAVNVMIHLANGLYFLRNTSGAADPVVRGEVRVALVAYLDSLLEH